MSELTGFEDRRADAQRSITAILDAAIAVLGERPKASMSEVAAAAGVSRQTVYAHYPSREALLEAVRTRALEQAVIAIDAAEPERGEAVAALDRLVSAGWQTLAHHSRLFEALNQAVGPEELRSKHSPILARLEPLVARGQREDVFDRAQPAPWLVAAVLALLHAAAAEVGAGRMDAEHAEATLRVTVPRALGVV
jgi:AcrR family transcriptional regulator